MKGPRPASLVSLALCAGLCGCRKPGPRATGDRGLTTSRGTCSGPGYQPGPRLAPSGGDLPFEVFESCLWPRDARLAIGVRLRPGPRPNRSEVQALLKHLWSEAHDALGARFPRKVQICVFDRPGGWSPDFLGCLDRGQEPLAEDEVTDGGEEPPELENHAPFSPAEEAARIEGILSAGATGAARPRVQVDEGHRRLSVTFPLEGGRPGRPGCGQAVAAFLRAAWTFYPATTGLTAFSFTGTWRGRPVLAAEIPDEAAFLAMKPWPLRAQLETHPPAQLERDLRSALDRLRARPGASVRLDTGRCRWLGR